MTQAVITPTFRKPNRDMFRFALDLPQHDQLRMVQASSLVARGKI